MPKAGTRVQWKPNPRRRRCPVQQQQEDDDLEILLLLLNGDSCVRDKFALLSQASPTRSWQSTDSSV